jgi:hypothetical protein
VFQNWFDGSTANLRTFTPPAAGITVYSADFQTLYQLTALASPVSGGTVNGAGYYAATDSAAVAAIPNPGFVFTGFSGALSGLATPQTVVMNAPQTVTANFAATPPAALAASISAKTGVAADRVWTVTVTNGGPGIAYDARVYGVMLTQTYGTACTAMPVGLSPPMFPVTLGTLAAGGSAQTAVAFNFSGCPSTARFTASIGYMSNGGWSVGLISLANQLQ